MSNLNMITPLTVQGIINKFCYTIGMLPTSYKDSLTYEEQLIAIGHYLESTVYPAINNNAQALEELQELFTALQNYVTNYFDDLDVQTEINNKLDQMAQSGQLTDIIGEYVDPKLDDFRSNVNNQIANQNAEIQLFETTTQGSIDTQNTSISSLESRINGVASGSPAGIYATLEDLQTADPDHSRIYVVMSNGYWYYYDTTEEAWTMGAPYQAYDIIGVQPWQTSFYADNNLFPKNNYIQGKVLNVSNGAEVTWATGSYNAEYIPVDNTKLYLVINNTELGYSTPTFYTYDDEKTFLGYVRPNADTRSYSVSFSNDVDYVRVGFWNVNSKNLALDCIFLTLEDALKLPTYKSNYYISSQNFNAIETNDIYISNDYGFRLLPFQSVATGNSYTTLYFPTIYEMKSTNVAVGGGNYLGVAFDYDTTKLKVGDKIYVDTKGSSSFGGLSLFATTSGSSNTLTFTNLGNGLYSATLTQAILTAMNNAKGVNNYYPRIMAIRASETAGETITTNMRCWINEDFTDLTHYLEHVTQELTDAKSHATLKALVLGDSITALTGNRSWLSYFNEIQPIETIQNVAVNGAWLMDKEGTIYDGNPVFNGPDNNVNNVLGNQVQKIINNDYATPDIILIAIGTNGGINCTKEDIYNSYYDNAGNLIPIGDVDRKTSAGAFRYCNTVLRSKYPNATIFWCSPIQEAATLRTPDQTLQMADNLKNLTDFASVQFINTADCGITSYTETNGSNGAYLIDGLHPNANGAKYMGYYNATQVKNFTKQCKLLNP